MMNGDRTCPSNKPYHDTGSGFKRELFPWLEETLGPLGERYQRLVRVVELVRVEEWLTLQPGLVGPAAGGSRRAGAGLSGESGAGRVHHPGAGRAAEDGTYPAPPVRLGGGGWGAERGDLLARVCGIRRQRPAGAPA